MGCGTSNQIDVIDPQAPSERKEGSAKRRRNNKTGPADSDVCSIASERGGSATSKMSRHSGDSGFDDEEEQRNIQREILSRPVMSAKVERVEEKQLLETLHEEGLIQKSLTRATFGVSFEVMSELNGTVRRPPPRLAKLEMENKKKKKKVLTEAEIRQKLERAEQRRKEREQERLDKIHSLQKTDIQSALDTYTQSQKEIVETTKSKEEIAAENREKKLREKLERLQAKKEHAAAVRQRRLVAAATANQGDNNNDNNNENIVKQPQSNIINIDERPVKGQTQDQGHGLEQNA